MLSILISTILISSAYGFYPYETDFTLKYFNDSNCTNIEKTTDIPLYCDDFNIIDEYPSCCWSILRDFQLDNNSTFNSCYQYESRKSISYDCVPTNNTIVTEKIFFLIGLIAMTIILIFIFSYCIHQCILSIRGRNKSLSVQYSPI
jgi:hypothetical protein